jgi:transposase
MFIYQTQKKEQYYDKVIEARMQHGYSVRRLTKIFPLSKHTIERWIANFAQDNPEVPIMKQRKVQTTKPIVEPEPRQELPDDVKALQAELARVKEELRKEKLRADAYDTMIDIAEDMFKVPIRKKAGAKR